MKREIGRQDGLIYLVRDFPSAGDDAQGSQLLQMFAANDHIYGSGPHQLIETFKMNNRISQVIGVHTSAPSGQFAIQKALEMELRDAVSFIVVTSADKLQELLPPGDAEAIVELKDGLLTKQFVKSVSPRNQKLIATIVLQLLFLFGVTWHNLKQIKLVFGYSVPKTLFD